jgi:hypothetical protein
MKIALATLAFLVCLTVPAAWAAAGDQTVTLTVPVNVNKLLPAVKSIKVRCSILDNGNGIVAQANNPSGTSPWYPVQNGAANVQAQVPVVVPAAQLAQAKGYFCLAVLSDGNSEVSMLSFSNSNPLTQTLPGAKIAVYGPLY